MKFSCTFSRSWWVTVCLLLIPRTTHPQYPVGILPKKMRMKRRRRKKKNKAQTIISPNEPITIILTCSYSVFSYHCTRGWRSKPLLPISITRSLSAGKLSREESRKSSHNEIDDNRRLNCPNGSKWSNVISQECSLRWENHQLQTKETMISRFFHYFKWTANVQSSFKHWLLHNWWTAMN